MAVSARACVSCETPLPTDAVFCHRCGARTPQEINRATGEVAALPFGADRNHAARLQAALGDSCEVRRLLGRGGFAEVFVAYDKRLKREIAVKTLRGDVTASPMMLERFQREAEAVAKLRHPNVVPIFSVGEGEGLAWYTMPLIDGESLAAALEREGRLTVAESVRILRDAAHALHAAHRAGIVHRDVKPENIMLEGPERAVVVMDFGIAKTMSGEGEDRGLTGTGMLVGTPQYMSPEQAAGERSLDHRSDQYSLAMVGYRMLTGGLPFERESVQTILFKTVTETPPAPIVIAADVPRELSDAVMRALAKEPGDRFTSMGEFAAVIGGFAGSGEGAKTTTARRRPRDMPTRVREARERLPRGARQLWIAAAIIAAAATAIYISNMPQSVRMLAGERDQAIFAASTLVNSLSPPEPRAAYARIIGNDTVLRHVRMALSYREADRRASKDIPVWEWSIVLPSSDQRETWQVWVAPESRITGYRLKLADTLKGARIGGDSARRLATAAVTARGWRLAGLEALPDSIIQRPGRTDHLVRWMSDSISVSAEGDTGRLAVRVNVAGDRVVGARTQFQVSRRSSRATGPAMTAFIGFGMIAALIGLVATVIRWSRQDELQWSMIFRILLFAGLLTVGALVATVLREAAGGSDIGSTGGVGQLLLGAVIGVAFLGVIVLCSGVVGESLAQRIRPSAVAGVDDMSRGRMVIPEIVPAAAIGYVAGALAFLTETGMNLLALRFGWRTDFTPHGAFSVTPILDPLSDTGGVLLLAVALLGGVMVGRAWRWTSRIAFILPGVVIASIPALAGKADATTLVGIVMTAAFAAAALWYGGLFAAFVALLMLAISDKAVASLLAGGHYILPGFVTLAILLLPAALAFVSARRLFVRSSTTTATTLR